MVGETQVFGSAVVALAGRRIDASGSDSPRFPLENVPLVRRRLRHGRSRHPTAYVPGDSAAYRRTAATTTTGASMRISRSRGGRKARG